MERNVTYLTEEELNRIVDEAITDWAKNNLVHPLKQGWDAYKNAQQQNKQNGMGATKGAVNAIKAGAGATANAIGQNVDAADQANYNSRTYNADGTIKKPGFFDGTFTAIADYATGGKWSRVRNGIAKYNIQKAYDKDKNAAKEKYEQRLFDFWTQNVKGKFTYTPKYTKSGRLIKSTESPSQKAVNMWSNWYEDQTGVEFNVNNLLNHYIRRYIEDKRNGGDPRGMSYAKYLEWKNSLLNKKTNESLQRLLRKNLRQLI